MNEPMLQKHLKSIAIAETVELRCAAPALTWLQFKPTRAADKSARASVRESRSDAAKARDLASFVMASTEQQLAGCWLWRRLQGQDEERVARYVGSQGACRPREDRAGSNFQPVRWLAILQADRAARITTVPAAEVDDLRFALSVQGSRASGISVAAIVSAAQLGVVVQINNRRHDGSCFWAASGRH
ncbi:hypothetical protein G7046_g6649 [Stylonectria norvegica]|nr:hypothetical protein G7046_g6649 [Stylonectria norvegica]